MNSLPLMDTNETAAFVHLKPATLRYYRHIGKGPKSFVMGGRRVLYRREDVEAWYRKQYEAAQEPA
jgi:predicted DNA-binding transcriptional regulator AlpA